MKEIVVRGLALGFGTVAGVVALAGGAEAQGWLSNRARTEGAGIRIGRLELHPGVGAEVGYDSNVFYSDDAPQGTALLRLTPHLVLTTEGEERRQEDPDDDRPPPAIAFRGGLKAGVYHYFATTAPTNVDGGASLDLTINPERPFQLQITEHFTRSVRPFTEEGPADTSYARSHNRAGIEARFGTEGEILQGRVGYDLDLNRYSGGAFNFANSLTHSIEAGTVWRFFPHSALVHDVTVDLNRYPDGAASDSARLSNGSIVRTRFGANGAITPRFSLMALVGYSAGFFETGDDYDSVVGNAELRWALSEGSDLRLGFERDFQNSAVGNFVARNRGYLGASVLFAGSLYVAANAAAGYHEFGSLLTTTGAPLGADGASDRADVRVEASLFAEYRLANWLGVNSTVAYTGNFTDFAYQRTGGATASPDPAEYQKLELWFGGRAYY